MSLFQKSVLHKFLKSSEGKKLDAAWESYTTYFHNPTIQENIRNAKEEQYQEGFLRELFVKVLGYTLNPDPDFNLTTELKNVKDSKKADGAILIEGQPIAVIELKGTNTTDLNKVEAQAFGYKNNQPTAVYIITSNFEKLRFYIENAVDFEEFNLFQLTKERFAVLWLCLAKENVFKGLPKKIKDSSLLEEENVTKKLYKDYSAFRRELFESIAEKNTDIDKVLLFKKTQKLLDRFLFIFFAEDRLLLPPNSISKIIEQWVQLRDELDAYTPLYTRFKKYFEYMNTGYKGKEYEIFAYNGGLFKPDDILDNITIDDTLLYTHTLTLSKYDFQTEVDVNILGHIFEHSLNELEEITAQLEGKELDKGKTKRKKDGVFYTPKYITKYIVENTVGKLCEEKRAEHQVIEEDYTSEKKRTKKKKKELLDKLEAYRAWLLQITICDPACGSGAFLNQALEFLIAEHGRLDELQTKLLGGLIVFPDVSNSILENNLYGVDINEESVDIAKLSLWLRTAQKGRKLTSLNKNIKCGNSLIDDVGVAGDKAFVWEKEFAQIFEKGGFDVVVGNPPYVRQELIKPFKPYLEKTYKTFQGTADLFIYFIEISLERLLNKNGLYSIIVANKWMRANYGKPLRKWMKEKRIVEIIDFGDLPVFSDATAYPCILTLSPNNPTLTFLATEPKSLQFADLELYIKNYSFNVNIGDLSESGWALVNEGISNLVEKLKNTGIPLKEYVKGKIYRGVLTGLNEAFVISQSIKNQLISDDPKSKEIIKPFLAGRDVKRYTINFQYSYLLLFPSGWTNKNRGDKEAWEFLQQSYPAIANHLKPFQEKAEKRYDKGDYWWELRACAYYDEFEKPKILYAEIATRGQYYFDENNFFIDTTGYILGTSDKGLIGLFNSKLWTFLVKMVSSEIRGGFLRWKKQYVENLPIKNGVVNLEPLVASQEIKIKEFNTLKTKIVRLIQRKFNIEKVSKNIQNWDTLVFADFLKELKKKKIKLTLSEEAEWEDYFEQEKAKAVAIQAEIDKTDKEIDQMVYELYGLTDEEVKIVENT